jgi:hypothetical protein
MRGNFSPGGEMLESRRDSPQNTRVGATIYAIESQTHTTFPSLLFNISGLIQTRTVEYEQVISNQQLLRVRVICINQPSNVTRCSVPSAPEQRPTQTTLSSQTTLSDQCHCRRVLASCSASPASRKPKRPSRSVSSRARYEQVLAPAYCYRVAAVPRA